MVYRRMLAVLLVAGLLGASLAGVAAQPSTEQHFQGAWDRTDLPVAEGVVERTWMWGEPVTDPMSEEYQQSPDGQRTVQYFDKSRMEITQPDADQSSVWYVTNGLLVVEMITGRVQIGETDDEFTPNIPANVPIAGDLDDPSGPTYASLSRLLDEPPAALREAMVTRLDRDGTLTQERELGALGVTATFIDDVTNHAIAEPFWLFMNSTGTVWEDGEYTDAGLFQNPFYATGRPISEAYWADVVVAGTPQMVLLQCFERRCLTYTPDNATAWQVEAGNVGLHYYNWRYAQSDADGRLLSTGRVYSEGLGRFVNNVFTVNVDGSNPLNLSNNTDDEDRDPVWSPDGTQVAFARGEGWDSRIFVVNADGSQLTQLTFDGFSYKPVWSPDGSQIAFERQVNEDELQIFVMDADGSNQRQLTFIEPVDDSGSSAMNPAWSPDGTQIAFSGWTASLPPQNNVSTIYVVNADGTGLNALHTGPDADVPLWSPDGSRIAFVYQGGGGSDMIGTRLFTMNSDGSDVTEIRLESGQPGRNDHHSPDWSPDGTYLVYVQNQGIYRTDPDGTNQVQLVDRGSDPAWSHDGQHIAFINHGIFVMDADGSNRVPVTGEFGSSPAWQP